MRALLRLGAAIYVVSVFVHFLWEMAQSFAYEMAGLPLERVVLNHFLATLADGMWMLAQYGAVALIRRDPEWIGRMRWADAASIAGLGLALGVAIERWALGAGRWSYTPAMPLLPGIGVGLLPVLQLMLLPLPIFWAAHRLATVPAGRGRS